MRVNSPLSILVALGACHIYAIAFSPISFPCKRLYNKKTSHHFVSCEINHTGDKNIHDEGNDKISYNRRVMASATLGMILGMTTSKSTIEPANAASEIKRLPLDVIVNKIETGLYFGPNMRKNLDKVPQFVPNSNGAPEKHLPQVVVNGNEIEISANHVMTEEHYIQYIWLRDIDKDEVVLVKACTASEDKPFLKARVPSGVTLSPCLYCNLHGLWRGEPFTVA